MTDAVTCLIGFRRHLRVDVSGRDRVYLFAERGVTELRGPEVAALAPLLDGSRDMRALVRDAPVGIQPHDVACVVGRLAGAGVLVARPAAEPPADPGTLAYWEAAGMAADPAVAATTGGMVRLSTVGSVAAAATRQALSLAGLTVVDAADSSPCDLTIVLCDDYLDAGLADVDAAHRRDGRPWLLAKPTGAIVWLGPVFEPGRPGCWHCLATRLWGNRSAEYCAQQALGRSGPAVRPAASLPALTTTAAHMVALEATKWLGGHRHPHQNSVWTFDSMDMAGTHHEVRALPQCAACGDPGLMGEQAHRPVLLDRRSRSSDLVGGHRALPPEQIRTRYRRLVSPVTGIIKEIRRAEHGPAFFNSFRSGANVATTVRDMDMLRAVVRSESGGKGITAAQAEVSALCEAIERYSGTFQGDEKRIRGSLASLGARAIHPNDCQLYDERQYHTRTAWNACHSQLQHVGHRFDEREVTEWTPVWSMTRREHRLLPTAMLYFGAPATSETTWVRADSNGSAAGSSIEDAVLQGLLELVERDAVALWWYNRSLLPGVDLDAFADPWLRQLREVYAELGREVWALDVTADLGVPTVVAMSRRIDRPREEIMFGFGAHLDPRIALVRAFTELNQLMPALLDDSREDHGCDDPDALRWWRHATVANQPYLLADPGRPPRAPVDFEHVDGADLHEEVALIQRRVESLGMELLVLDQTRPDIGLPVVKVIVPGLRHFWARFAPGRLYDVPVRLGRQDSPTRYEDHNPIPMFL